MDRRAMAVDRPMGEMNTTPLIDVMLVLLIMFMLNIPMQTHAVKIDLPQTTDPNTLPPPNPVKNKIIVTRAGQVQWNGLPVTLDQMYELLRQTTAMRPEPELQFQPAPDARYVVVDTTLAKIKLSGVTKFGFVGNEQYRLFGKANLEPARE